MSSIDYAEKIPNNVNLQNDRTLQRALERWQPQFLQWWHEMGPTDFESADVYLRTAISVDAQGWAHYGKLKMPDYRWGIFLADAVAQRKIGFGDQMGQPVWQQVPGEYRSTLRRLIVTQGDTVPAPCVLRPRRARGGRRAADAPLGRPEQAAHPHHLQRADDRLAVALLLHLLHRPRRQVPA
jgi:hypothetical protein